MRMMLIGLVLTGCAGANSPKSRYLVEEQACVDDFATRAEIDACRAGVRSRAGLPPRSPSGVQRGTVDGGGP